MTMDQVEGPQPSSTPLERDARLVSTDHKVAPSEIAIGVIIGRAAEYFDFFVFAIASVVVFPKVFFPFAEPVTATLYSFAMFSLAFVARPIGSIIFTAVDRRHGRGVKLTIALFLLGFSTMAISFLPGYAQIGAWSLYLLGILRIGQGLALGGAWDGLASLLALNAPIERRGFYAAIPQLGAPLGFMVARRAVRVLPAQPVGGRFPGLGLALSLLLRLRRQRRGLVLAACGSSPPRSSRAFSNGGGSNPRPSSR